METINLFAVPVFKFRYPKHKEQKLSFMGYLESDDVYKNVRNPGTSVDFTSPNLHKIPLFKEISKFFVECVNQSMEELGYVGNTQITSLWGTRHKEGIGHHKHYHSNTFLAGVYYLHGSENSSGTIFYNNRPYTNYIVPELLPQRQDKDLYRNITDRWASSFEEGAFLVFPAWLEHSTQINEISTTGTNRYVLAINTMPVGSTNNDVFDRFNYREIKDSPMVENLDQIALKNVKRTKDNV